MKDRMEKKSDTRLTLYLPIDLHMRLKAHAALTNKSMRDVIVEALENQFKKSINQKIYKLLIKDIENS